jgi:hypothetical protein
VGTNGAILFAPPGSSISLQRSEVAYYCFKGCGAGGCSVRVPSGRPTCGAVCRLLPFVGGSTVSWERLGGQRIVEQNDGFRLHVVPFKRALARVAVALLLGLRRNRRE